jgi:alpha-L-fucosidase
MKRIIILIIAAAIIGSCGQKDYLNETPEAKQQRLEWWKDAKFGMFIHWGVYSVPAGWYNDEMVPGASEWLMYFAKISPGEYEKFASQFNPVEYEPEKWVKLAKNAGMKYIVITSKHHDGFCLWDSKVTGYDVVDFTPYQKDLLKPLAEACRKEGIKLGFYHSILDWHHPDAEKENFHKYRDEYLIPQLEELLDSYPELAILWFDGEWIDEWTEEQGRELYNRLRNISPEIIINNRIGKGRQGMQGMNKDENSVGDFGTPEQEILETASSFPWESCMTMNDSWGFKKGDENWKSAETLIRNIIDITSKGGNYLLNVGPTSLGTIPTASIERLEKIGKWMSANGEGIYNTRPLSNYEENSIIRYTKSKNTNHIYMFLLEETSNSEIEFSYVTPEKNSEIYLLGKNIRLEYSVDDKTTTVKIPAEITIDDYPLCLKIQGIENEVAESPQIIADDKQADGTYLFQDKVEVEIIANGDIYYTVDGSLPDINSMKYNSKIVLNSSTFLQALNAESGKVNSPLSEVQFYKIQSVSNLEIKNDLSEKYSAEGKLSLVDGRRGTLDYNKNWLGFEGEDVEIKIDLGKIKKINGIHIGSLSNINAWIFLPKKVEFLISDDNKKYKKIHEFNYSVSKSEKQGGYVKDISATVTSETRYIKILAESIKKCPEWHIGNGGNAWVFFDEIIID